MINDIIKAIICIGIIIAWLPTFKGDGLKIRTWDEFLEDRKKGKDYL